MMLIIFLTSSLTGSVNCQARNFARKPCLVLIESEKWCLESEKYIWSIAEQVDSSHVKPTTDKKAKGLDFKFIMQKDLAKALANAQDTWVIEGSRYVERVPVTLVITENYATVVFRRNNGVMDYMGLFGTDEKFCKWCKDLFLYYWERAERWYPGIQIK